SYHSNNVPTDAATSTRRSVLRSARGSVASTAWAGAAETSVTMEPLAVAGGVVARAARERNRALRRAASVERSALDLLEIDVLETTDVHGDGLDAVRRLAETERRAAAALAEEMLDDVFVEQVDGELTARRLEREAI